MKRLLLLRHAKAIATAPGGDFDRALAPHGRDDAARMGAYLRDAGLAPDLTIASPARRTRETADLALASFSHSAKLHESRALYLAEPHAILDEIRNTDAAVRTLLVIGHNPGLADLANLLVANGDPEARAVMMTKFPTAALAVIDLPIDVWQGASFHEGTLERFNTPKRLP